MGGQGWGAAVVGVLVAIVCGLGWGIFNGVLIARAKVPPLIVTLGTLGMALGLAQVITKGVDLRNVPTVLVNKIGFGNLFWQVPNLSVIVAVVVVDRHRASAPHQVRPAHLRGRFQPGGGATGWPECDLAT